MKYRTRERLIDGSLWTLWGVFRILMCIGILFGSQALGKAAIDYANRPPSFGQNIGGGIHTMCHGTDRIYASAHGLAVIHNDTTCHPAG